MTPLDKSHAGIGLLKEAVIEYLQQNPGSTNIEIARGLDLESEFEGGQKNYLSWSVLGVLLEEKAVRYEKRANSRRYYAHGDAT